MPAAGVHSEGGYRWREQAVWSPWESLMFNKIFLRANKWRPCKKGDQDSPEADHMGKPNVPKLSSVAQSFKIRSKSEDQQCNRKLHVDNDWLKL